MQKVILINALALFAVYLITRNLINEYFPFQKNMQALRVTNSFARGPAKGNCRGFSSDYSLDAKENRALPRRCQNRPSKKQT